MSKIIPINLAAEDELSEVVSRKLLKVARRSYAVGTCYSQGGFGYLRRTIVGFNNAAKGTPFFVLTDLDKGPCAPALIGEWLPVPKHPNLIFRVAVKEVEAWLLADKTGFADFLRIRYEHIPSDIESILDPKGKLIELAQKSPSRDVREDIVPPRGSIRIQGPNYNGRLTQFVQDVWSPDRAAKESRSLARTLARLKEFTPTWG